MGKYIPEPLHAARYQSPEPVTLPEPDLSDCIDLVDFYIKCDAIANRSVRPVIEMSQKKCRFCS